MNHITLRELAHATRGTLSPHLNEHTSIQRVSLDSRAVQPGDAFWAVRGERFDGHQFTSQAQNSGAAVCITDAAGQSPGRRLQVENTHEALQQFARWYRSRQTADIIGVTGSFGKTTTRTMIHAVLASRFSGVQSPKNYNNHFGLPLSLLQIESHHRFAVLELGASAAGEIADLASVAKPDIGVVTGIGPAHLDGFGSLEQIVQTKGELIESLPANGFAVLNGDDPRVKSMADRAACAVITVGENDDNDLVARRMTKSQCPMTNDRRKRAVDDRIENLTFQTDGHIYQVPTHATHFLTAAVAAVAIGRKFGLTPRDIQNGLDTFTPPPGRFTPQRIGAWTIIDDTYNANPRSMRAAIETLKTWNTNGRRILVAGEMKELGDQAKEYHQSLGRHIASSDIDHVFLIGNYTQETKSAAIAAGQAPDTIYECASQEEIHECLVELLEPNDVVLVKGSRSNRLERVIEVLRMRTFNIQRSTSNVEVRV